MDAQGTCGPPGYTISLWRSEAATASGLLCTNANFRPKMLAMPVEVSTVVYPLLERGNTALHDVAFTTNLRQFLCGIEAPYVLFDYPNDGALLRYALAGFDLPDTDAYACGQIPSPVMTEMLSEGLIAMVLEDWFQHYPDVATRRHHAAVDAEALRHAWLAATGRIEASWSPTLAKTITTVRRAP